MDWDRPLGCSLTTSEATRLLGLAVPYTESELRVAYHARAKELHPDVSSEASGAHLLMVELNQAYHHLLGKVTRAPAKGQEPGVDYELYRRGVSTFERIHPSEWIRVTAKGLFDPSAIESKSADPAAYQLALQRISEAYQSFSELVNGYPESPWAPDAQDKLRLLDKMIVRYRKMLANCP